MSTKLHQLALKSQFFSTDSIMCSGHFMVGLQTHSYKFEVNRNKITLLKSQAVEAFKFLDSHYFLSWETCKHLYSVLCTFKNDMLLSECCRICCYSWKRQFETLLALVSSTWTNILTSRAPYITQALELHHGLKTSWE